MSDKNLDSSNNHMGKLKKITQHSISFPKAFEEVSKNEGISILILDPTETHLQILHHDHVLRGSWTNPTKKLIAVLGFDEDAKPVQIAHKSVKNIKERSFSFEALQEVMDDEKEFVAMVDPDAEFLHKNILPIPNSLMKIFIQLDSTTPYKVAKAFMKKISVLKTSSIEYESPSKESTGNENDPKPSLDLPSQEGKDINEITLEDTEGEKTDPDTKLSPEDTIQIIQFCPLCATSKIPPVTYSLLADADISSWFKSISKSSNNKSETKKRTNPATLDTDSESGTSSPENKISKMDHYLINTMIKLHDTMDKSSKSKEDKEPGFKRLESHRKKLILNASALPPFTQAADEPTEFYSSFLAKKSQFKAKDMLLHRFHADKISFNPNSTFTTNLWNSEFFWLLPDSPSGISLFYCPETKSLNSSELEKERNFALADKVNTLDIDKLSKQKMSLPMTLMDLVWMTQNLHAVISLCFGVKSHSASFLQGWIDHIYNNRIIYQNLYSSNPYFYAKVMFTIDNTLQKHWRSCSSAEERSSVNDSVLWTESVHDSILMLNFTQILPKSIMEKVQKMILLEKDEKDKGARGAGNGKFGKKFPGSNNDKQDKQDLVYDNEKSHQQ